MESGHGCIADIFFLIQIFIKWNLDKFDKTVVDLFQEPRGLADIQITLLRH